MKSAILKELQCRTGGGMHIAGLVEDYGPEVKVVLQEMRKNREVRLVACGCLAMAAAGYYYDDQNVNATKEQIADYRNNSIEGVNEIFTWVELRD